MWLIVWKIKTNLLCANWLDQFNADERPMSVDVRSVKIPWYEPPNPGVWSATTGVFRDTVGVLMEFAWNMKNNLLFYFLSFQDILIIVKN